MTSLVPLETIIRQIYVFRGLKVMVDSDLADLYCVETKVFNQAVKRNLARFPADFMFQLTEEEFEALRSQTVTSNEGRGGRRFLPYVFTEQGVAMLSSVLRSERAIEINIAIMRAFVRLRELLTSNEEIARRLADIERKIDDHDESIRVAFDALRQLMTEPEPEAKRIGFQVGGNDNKPPPVRASSEEITAAEREVFFGAVEGDGTFREGGDRPERHPIASHGGEEC